MAIGSMRLWRDEPAASTMTVAESTSTLEARVEALPTKRPLENKRFRRLLAEVKSESGVREVGVYLTGKSPTTSPAELHTGNGQGDWIKAGDFIRIVAIDESY